MGNPEISVIIPTHNRLETLRQVLDYLQEQDCPLDLFQVIVIDDNSKDGTWNYLSQFSSKTLLKIRVLQCNFENAGAARNLGVREATAPLLVFLDTDIYVNADFISKHLAFHQIHTDENMVLQGRVEMAKELLVPDQVRHGIWNPPVEKTNLFETEWQSFRAANTSLKKRFFGQVGGFNFQLCAAEDTELGYRLWKNEARFVFDNSIITTHYHPLAWGQYLEKAKKYGQSIAIWYYHEPDVQPELVDRYSLCVKSCRIKRKIKYFGLRLILNRRSIPKILDLTKRVSQYWHPLPLKIYKIIFQYQLVHSFRTKLNMPSSDKHGVIAKCIQ